LLANGTVLLDNGRRKFLEQLEGLGVVENFQVVHLIRVLGQLTGDIWASRGDKHATAFATHVEVLEMLREPDIVYDEQHLSIQQAGSEISRGVGDGIDIY
jgi:hypothetical protein